MSTITDTARLHRVGLSLVWFLLLSSALGCSHARYSCLDSLDQRILAPGDLDIHEQLPSSRKATQEISNPKNDRRASDEASAEKGAMSAPAVVTEISSPPVLSLTLGQAIDTAFRQQPRLRVYLESVEQARRAADIAFAPFLPVAVAGYSVGGFDLKVRGQGLPLGPPPGFTLLPSLRAIPIGLKIATGYDTPALN